MNGRIRIRPGDELIIEVDEDVHGERGEQYHHHQTILVKYERDNRLVIYNTTAGDKGNYVKPSNTGEWYRPTKRDAKNKKHGTTHPPLDHQTME